jgi:hypothetical protein
MPSPVEFQINILGNAAAQLGTNASAARAMDKGMTDATGSTAKLEKALDGVGGKAKEKRKDLEEVNVELGKLGGFNFSAIAEGGKFFTFDLAEGFRTAVEWAGELVEKLFDVSSEIVKVGGEAQDLNLAIKLKVGEGGAEQVEGLAGIFDGLTRFDDDVIKKGVLPLLDIGLNNDSGLLTDLATVAADLETRSAGRQKLGDTLQGFEQLARKGEVSPRLLTPLGIGTKEYYETLAASLKTDVETAKKRATAGKVDQERLLQALVQTVANREGGAIGGAALEGGQTLGASLQRLADLKDNLFKSVADSPGLKSVQSAIDAFVDFAKGPVGQGLLDKIAASIGKVADSVLKFISSEDGQKRIVDVVERLGTALFNLAEAAPAVINALAKISSFGSGVIDVYGAVASVPGAVADAPRKPFEYVASLFDGAPKANDFIWRNGQAIQIDPNDSVMGFKPGGSLGIDSLPQAVGGMAPGGLSGGHSFGGDTYQITVSGGAGSDETATKIEQIVEGIIRRKEQRMALMLGAA